METKASNMQEQIDALTCSLVLSYDNREYENTLVYADAILVVAPHDMVALHYKALAVLNGGAPGELCLHEALELWSEAVEHASLEDKTLVLRAIEKDLPPLLYGKINQAAAYWKAYENEYFADELVALFLAIESCEECCGSAYLADIAELFRRIVAFNSHKWIALVTGQDFNIPVELAPLRLRGYATVFSCMSIQATRMLERAGFEDERNRPQEELVARRSFATFQRFARIHPDALSEEQKLLLESLPSE